jgi:hypothetical protein
MQNEEKDLRDRTKAFALQISGGRVAELVFWAIVGGQEVLRRKVSLRCAPKPVRRWCSVEERINYESRSH